jgi:hypothetical protein
LVRFEDGLEGAVDVSDLVGFEGVFAPLKAANQFRQASVHPELSVVCWPNGADLGPDVLYAHLTGGPIQIGSPTVV